jgi:hypothetical protein
MPNRCGVPSSCGPLLKEGAEDKRNHYGTPRPVRRFLTGPIRFLRAPSQCNQVDGSRERVLGFAVRAGDYVASPPASPLTRAR